MKRTSLALFVTAALLAVPTAAMAGERHAKVTLCHVSGNGHERTIEVSERAAFGWVDEGAGDHGERSENKVSESRKGRTWSKSLGKSSHHRVKDKMQRVRGHLNSHKRDYLGACEGDDALTTTTTSAPVTTTTAPPTTTTTQAPVNLPPVATMDVTFVPSGAGYVTHMDASRSFDPEGNGITFTWTHSIAGVFGNTVESSSAMVWDTAGVYTSGRSIVITLQVSDGTFVDTAIQTVVVP